MASTISIYRGPILIGTASVSANGHPNTFTAAAGAGTGTIHAVLGKRIGIVVTQAGTHIGRSYFTRCTANDGAGNLTMQDKCPFVGA
jgi:hypothetical protein